MDSHAETTGQDFRRATIAGVVAFIAAAAFSAYTNLWGEAADELGGYAILIGIMAVATVAVFRFVVAPSLEHAGAGNRPATAGLWTSGLAVVSVLAFWSGLPVILGVAGIVLGSEGRARAAHGAPRGGLSVAAVVVGVLALCAQTAAVISDKL